MRTLSRRLLFAVLPALVLAAAASSVVWGDNGLLVRHQIEGQAQDAQRELARLDRENERLLKDLRSMDQDPIVRERLVADELQWGRPDAVLVRFDDGAR